MRYIVLNYGKYVSFVGNSSHRTIPKEAFHIHAPYFDLSMCSWRLVLVCLQLLEDVRQLPSGRGRSRGTDVLQEIVLELNDVQHTSEEQHRKMSPLELSRDSLPDGTDETDGKTLPQDGEAALRGFRRLLWFWSEYYLRGGRDRLSLEFSTHVKFWAWKRVIGLLCADNGSPTALVDEPISLPRSPFEVVASCPYPPHDLLR